MHARVVLFCELVLRQKMWKLSTDLRGGPTEDCDGACDKDPTRARYFAGLCIERERGWTEKEKGREREKERERKVINA